MYFTVSVIRDGAGGVVLVLELCFVVVSSVLFPAVCARYGGGGEVVARYGGGGSVSSTTKVLLLFVQMPSLCTCAGACAACVVSTHHLAPMYLSLLCEDVLLVSLNSHYGSLLLFCSLLCDYRLPKRLRRRCTTPTARRSTIDVCVSSAPRSTERYSLPSSTANSRTRYASILVVVTSSTTPLVVVVAALVEGGLSYWAWWPTFLEVEFVVVANVLSLLWWLLMCSRFVRVPFGLGRLCTRAATARDRR